MPTCTSTDQRATRFAAAVTTIVRKVLRRLPERQVIAFLDALNGKLGTELWAARMELESVAGTALHEDEVEV